MDCGGYIFALRPIRIITIGVVPLGDFRRITRSFPRHHESSQMLGLLLDTIAIIAIISIVNQGQQLEFTSAIISALIISAGNFVCFLLLGPVIGIFAVVPMFLVAIVVIWMVSGLPLEKAAIAGAIFVIYRIILSLAFSAMFA
jgi:hypothetical protein